MEMKAPKLEAEVGQNRLISFIFPLRNSEYLWEADREQAAP